MNRLRLVHRNTLSCEPILRRMENGEMLCVSQCGDVTEPAPGNRVYVFHSEDEGENWSAPAPIRPEDGQAVYLTEVACFPGRVVVYLTLHNGAFLNWRSECRESTDNGYTWRSVGPLAGEETYAFPRGVIRLRDGRYMMACQHYPITQEENDRLLREGLRWLHADIDRVENRILVSNDEGRTWRYVGQATLPMPGEIGKRWIWSEPTILELNDGRIAMLLRVPGTGRLYYAESHDGGATFTVPAPIWMTRRSFGNPGFPSRRRFWWAANDMRWTQLHILTKCWPC